MKAVVITEYGLPEVLQIKEIEKPVPKDNEVLVKNFATSINSADWDFIRGKPYLYRLLFGIQKPKFPILGCDFAGQIISTGKNVSRFKPGDEVYGDVSGCGFGAFAEFISVPENALCFKPAEMSFEEAACFPQAGVLALQSIYDKKPVKRGDKVLINGAGGSVGTLALQLAKHMGAEVTCVDRSDKLSALSSLGADHVIDYTREDFTNSSKKYHLIIDVIANRSVYKYNRSLLPDGNFIMIGGSISTLFSTLTTGSVISAGSSRKLGILAHVPNKNLEMINKLYTDGILKPVIDKVFSLEQSIDAFRYYSTGSFIGKIVITIPHK